MKRRDFIKLSAFGAAVLMMPSSLLASGSPSYEKMLVLIELEGGNDGLNTVVPYTDDTYYNLRPDLGIDKEKVLKPDGIPVGFHPKLQNLYNLFDDGSLAVIQGVGYPDPNLSHFRSKDILNSASDSDEIISDGWVKQAFETEMPPSALFADSVTMANDDTKPFQGGSMRNIVLESADDFLDKAKSVVKVDIPDYDALGHIAVIQNNIADSYTILDEAMRERTVLETEFPQTSLGDKFKYLSELLANGIRVPVFKVSLDGFDTHNNQAPVHERLMTELDDAMFAFSKALKEMKLWNDVITLTYSEFGRRPAQNGSGGTDHGTAAPHFMMGGAVRGGLYGEHPSLDALDDNGDLVFTTDFRSIYRSVIASWWKIESDYLSEYGTLGLFRS